MHDDDAKRKEENKSFDWWCEMSDRYLMGAQLAHTNSLKELK